LTNRAFPIERVEKLGDLRPLPDVSPLDLRKKDLVPCYLIEKLSNL
jgi:hypothetical protein